MEILFFLAIISNIALCVVMFVEIEHMIDNQLEFEKVFTRVLKTNKKRGKK